MVHKTLHKVLEAARVSSVVREHVKKISCASHDCKDAFLLVRGIVLPHENIRVLPFGSPSVHFSIG